MDQKLIVATSPHIHGKVSTTGIMRDVLIALTPATIASIVLRVIVYTRTIEICLLTIISPLPLSSLSGDTHYHIAKGFLKE